MRSSWKEFQIILAAAFVILMPLLLILVSYSLSLSAALQIRFAKSMFKAFSTCSSHFIVGKFFSGTAMFMPMHP